MRGIGGWGSGIGGKLHPIPNPQPDPNKVAPPYVCRGRLGVLTRVLLRWCCQLWHFSSIGARTSTGRSRRCKFLLAYHCRGVVLHWYVALYAQHGWVHIKEFFIDENVMRYAHPWALPPRHLVYVPVLLTDLFRGQSCCRRRGDRGKGVWSGAERIDCGGPGAAPAARLDGTIVCSSLLQNQADLYIFFHRSAVAALVAVLLYGSFRRSRRASPVDPE